MYGIILKFDAGRQSRVGTDVLQKLLSAKAYKKLMESPRALNASLSESMPFAPTLIRPAFYPERFRATELRTLFWKLKNMEGLHNLASVTFDDPTHLVFTFRDSNSDNEPNLTAALKSCGHSELSDPKSSGRRVTYIYGADTYSESQAGAVNE